MNNKIKHFVFVVLLLVGANRVSAEETPSIKSAPAKASLAEFERSQKLLNLQYERAKNKLEDTHADTAAKHKEKLLLGLEMAMKQAAQKVDLEEANAINVLIKKMKEEAKQTEPGIRPPKAVPPNKNSLPYPPQIEGTTWSYSDNTYTFRDGECHVILDGRKRSTRVAGGNGSLVAVIFTDLPRINIIQFSNSRIATITTNYGKRNKETFRRVE